MFATSFRRAVHVALCIGLGASIISCSRPYEHPKTFAEAAGQAHARGELNGNVLVARGGEVLYEASFGTANVETRMPNTPDSRFLVASVSKPFTAVLILQLIEQGKLETAQRLDSMFPTLAGTPAGAITIHQLLTHTSGIEEFISRDPMRRITAADLAAAKILTPGTFAYSNTGFVCLALVVERVTGKSFQAALQAGILEPAGMSSTGVLRSGTTPIHFAVGHRGHMELAPAVLDFAPEAVDGAGSIYSTARDLWRFDRALAAGQLLSPATQALMNEEHVDHRYAYGWFLNEQGGRYYPWHAGDMAGYVVSLARQINRDEFVVVLGNSASTEARDLQSSFLRLLKDKG